MSDSKPSTRSPTQIAAPSAAQAPSAAYHLRQPHASDGPRIHRLIAQCPPLDLNSLYCYLLLAEHFSGSCVLAEGQGGLDGFISAYVPPAKPDVLFVWQVAVHERARGKGLARQMLMQILQRPALNRVRFIETTVGPSNKASRRVFSSIAEALGAPLIESGLFDQSVFAGQGHDDEPLIRIGPFTLFNPSGGQKVDHSCNEGAGIDVVETQCGKSALTDRGE